MTPLRVLFLCTGNSARSQMAEGWARRLAPAGVEVWSAGTHPVGVNPLAVEAMRERSVDISAHRSKSLAEVPGEPDYVIALCAEADAECPTLPARRQRLAWHLPDPAKVSGSEEDKRQAFGAIRDRIEQLVRDLLSTPPFTS
ncbi:MAG: arsenate reductase ArsC [Candidatus Acidiferrales bacterium]